MNTLPRSLVPGAARTGQFAFVTGLCLLIAVSAFADTKLVSQTSPVRILVPPDGSLGGTWRGPAFDDSTWLSGQNGVGYEVNPGAFNTSVIADSRGEWSNGGRQGENSWINGYYDKTADPDATFQANDFQPFPRSDGPFGPDNFWDGGTWHWFNGNPPWDLIGASDVHPNGVNNAVEHWVIRRWASTTTGDITIRFHVRKSNPGGGGVTGRIFKNGVEIFTQAIAGGNTVGFEAYVNTTAAEGDVFDFALTPIGPGGDDGDGADGSIMTATILAGTVVPPPPPVMPMSVADSQSDWSGGGVQGANGWTYGFYNRTADGDGVYNPVADFNSTDPDWDFTGGAWQLGQAGDPNANPPWDTIGQTDWHPNGDNQPQGIHWVIRRWTSDVAGDLYARVRFAKSGAGGNGTTLHVLRNGTEVFTHTVPGTDTVGIDTFVPLTGVVLGDRIEFALDPKGSDGLFGDGSDSSTLSAIIFTGPVPEATLANSVTDWVTGAQGENNWFYGFYNKSADADGIYTPNTDFNNTHPSWTFTGSAWELGEGVDPGANPPWDTIGQTDWHPNGDNQPQGIHWMIKRWESEVDGDIQARVQFGKQNTGGGNGTTLRVLHNGTQVFSHTVAGTDGTGIDVRVGLPGVFIGDVIEFALDPLGTDGSSNDGADGSFIRATILTGLPPVPPPPFVPGIADCINTDIEAAMRGVNSSVFIRIPFDVTDPGAIESLRLRIKYNDGFAAYLNGTEIIKRNAPTAIAGITFADSIADWSTDPNVTVNGWSYGYYNQSLDADNTYSGGSDLTPFPHDGTGVHSPTEFWNVSMWDWFNGNPPWTELAQETTHPAHPNGAVFNASDPTTHIHWPARRWSATVDANLKARVRFRKTNTGCGDGVRLAVFHNSVQVYNQTIVGTDGIGRDDTIEIPDVFSGDKLDVLLGPNDGNDFCDGTAFSVVFFEGEPSVPWDAAATGTRTTIETIAPEIFDVSSFISQLVTGRNVLAIQGINAAVSDNEFLINAELLANQIPTAVNDALAANEDTTVDYPASALLANDSDPDGDNLLLVGVTPTYMTPQGGTVRLYGDTVRYTPAAGFSGSDSFQYTITDLSGIPVRATANITVAEAVQLNNPPSFTLAGSNVTQTTTAPRKVANWATNISPGPDPSEADQTVKFLTSNSHSNLFTVQPFINSFGTLIFMAKMGAMDVVTVTVRAMDNGGTELGGSDTSAPQTFTIRLAVPALVCPTAQPQSVTTDENTLKAINLTSAGNTNVVYTIGTPPAHGTLSGAPPAVVYTPSPGYCGSDSFTFTVSTPGCPISTATVSITIVCANRCPVARATVVPPLWATSSDMAFKVTLSGDQERPNPVVSPGAGLGMLTLHGNLLTVDIDYLNLSSPVTVGHIHGPATTAQAAGVLVGLIPQLGAPGGTAGSISGSVAISNAVAAHIANELTYVNIHTVNYPGGEIRGQVVRTQSGKFTVIAPNNRFVEVLFDGSQSSDPDGDPLSYAWYESAPPPGSQVPIPPGHGSHNHGNGHNGHGNDGDHHDDDDDDGYYHDDDDDDDHGHNNPPPPVTTPVLFGNGLVASRVLWLGQHNIQLRVSDGECSDDDTILVCVITPGDAVADCIELVNNSALSRKDKRTLIETLKKAAAEFDEGDTDRGIDKLDAFIRKAQDRRLNQTITAPLIACAQQLIDALE